EYPWHPLHGRRLRVYGHCGKRGQQILYVEVVQGISRELPAWMADAAACAAMSSGPPQVDLGHLNELRAILDKHSAKPAPGGSSTPSTKTEGSDATSRQPPRSE